MELTQEEQRNVRLARRAGRPRKAMEILVALGTIYGARAHAAGQLGADRRGQLRQPGRSRAGSSWTRWQPAAGRRSVLTTLNPAGMDIENWQALGISPEFAAQQQRVIEAFARMGVITTCTCTPYLSGNLPHFGEHIAWAESSAVCYANSVLGARTNREGGPSALAAALTGRTPAYGYHLDENRQPDLPVEVQAGLEGTHDFRRAGQGHRRPAGRRLERSVPYLTRHRAGLAGGAEIPLRQPGDLRRGGAVPHAGHHPRGRAGDAAR